MAVTFDRAEQRARERLLRLPDGRALASVERGDPAGPPILEFHGLPNPRPADTVSEAYLRDRSIRRITVDRPGLGFSDRSLAARCWTGLET